MTLKMVRGLALPRNLLLNCLPRSLLCYLGDNPGATTLWSTFHHTSQQGLAFIYTHPHILFVCWLCVDEVIILEPSQLCSVCYWPFDFTSWSNFLQRQALNSSENLHLHGDYSQNLPLQRFWSYGRERGYLRAEFLGLAGFTAVFIMGRIVQGQTLWC